MTRYFFDIHDGKIVLDDTGTELSNLDEARDFAVRLILRMAMSIATVRDAVQLRVHVRDPAGARCLTGTLLCLIEQAE